MNGEEVVVVIVQRQTFRNPANHFSCLWLHYEDHRASCQPQARPFSPLCDGKLVCGPETGQTVDLHFPHTNKRLSKSGTRTSGLKTLSAFFTSELQHHPDAQVCGLLKLSKWQLEKIHVSYIEKPHEETDEVLRLSYDITRTNLTFPLV